MCSNTRKTSCAFRVWRFRVCFHSLAIWIKGYNIIGGFHMAFVSFTFAVLFFVGFIAQIKAHAHAQTRRDEENAQTLGWGFLVLAVFFLVLTFLV